MTTRSRKRGSSGVSRFIRHELVLVRAALSGLLALSPLACSASLMRATGPSQAESIAAADASIPPNTIERRSVNLARAVPGFGGDWFDPEGNLHAYLLDLRDSAKLRKELQPTVDGEARYHNGVTPRIVFDQGKYDFRQLLMWRSALCGFPRVDGAQSLSISHQQNRVRIGVLNRKAIPAVKQLARQAQVPEDALIIEVEEELRA